jgi:hypothetical protein
MFTAQYALRLSELTTAQNSYAVVKTQERIRDFITNTVDGKAGVRECTVTEKLTEPQIQCLRNMGYALNFRNSQTFISW